MDDIFEPERKKRRPRGKQVGHLYRKLFLLVLAVMLLAQGMVLLDKGLGDYYQELAQSFKVILTVDGTAEAAQLEEWGQTLNQKEDITSVRLFSPEDALTVVRHKNPQLVDSLLLMGKNKMPAYFEITLSVPAVNNVGPFVDNLATEYEELLPHYNLQHARILFYVGWYCKIIRLLMVFSLLLFVTFMFLVEAAPYPHAHPWGGLFSGLLAGGLSCGFLVGVVYFSGLLTNGLIMFTTWHRQVLLVIFGALLGWTLSKWQKF